MKVQESGKYSFEEKIIGDIELLKNLSLTKKMENTFRLFKLRENLKNIVFAVLTDKKIPSNIENIEFLKLYKEYIETTNKFYPYFLFDDFDENIFSDLEVYIENGYPIKEIDQIYFDTKRVYKKIK